MTEIRKIWNNPFPLVTAYICRRQIVGDHHTLADKIRQDVWKSNMFKFSPTRSDVIVACRDPPTLADFLSAIKNRESPDKKSASVWWALYNFKRGLGWAYKRWKGGGGGRLISGCAYMRNKKYVSERRDKTYLRDELKLTYHYILSYIYNTFIVRHNKRRIHFKNIHKTNFRLKTLMFKKKCKRNTRIQWMGL